MLIKLPNITPKYVSVLNGAIDMLITERVKRHKYETNRSIKTWSTYFLLKSLSASGVIKDWTKQKQWLLSYCKMTENCFRTRLNELLTLKLIELQKNRSIKLTSFETAAGILGIEYTGTIKIEYNHELPGQQIFQYFLRAEELRQNQDRQLNAMWYYLNKQPQLKDALIQLLQQNFGSDAKKLQIDAVYFQDQLLQLQQKAFKEGSPLLEILHSIRADINRSVNKIQDKHLFKSAQSVSYMKSVMKKIGIIAIDKLSIESKERSRLYIPATSVTPRKDAYKWLPAKKVTAWVLCDQITVKFKTKSNEEGKERKKAA